MNNSLLLFFITLIWAAPGCATIGGFSGWIYALSKNLNGPETLQMLGRGAFAGIMAALVISILFNWVMMYLSVAYS
jgi:hypothetical protein